MTYETGEVVPLTAFEQTTQYLQTVLNEHGHFPEIACPQGIYIPLQTVRIDPQGDGYRLKDVHITRYLNAETAQEEFFVRTQAYDHYWLYPQPGKVDYAFVMDGRASGKKTLKDDEILALRQEVEDAMHNGHVVQPKMSVPARRQDVLDWVGGLFRRFTRGG